MALCALCQTVDFETLPPVPSHYNAATLPWKDLVVLISRPLHEAREAGQDESVGEFSQSLGLPHHQSIDELRTAAESCAICKIIDRGISQSLAALAEAEKDETYVYYRDKRKRSAPNFRLRLTKWRDNCDGFMVVSSTADDLSEVWLLAAVGFCVDDDDPLSLEFAGRIIQKEASSRKTLTRALNWVQECNMQHKDTKCSRGDVKLPLRVVDVEYDAAPSRIRLYEPNGMSGKYTALSYVWGKQNHYTTTKSSIDNHRQGIALDELPKTLQDAVTLTRKLGVQYLWVDALCIRQDDGPEWERESSKMADIYSNAYLTIAATGSEQATTGLFTQRTLPDYVKFKYTMDGVQGDIHAFLLQDALMPFSKGLLSDEPLSKRGWALQERFLASRNLHFATDQLFYECSGHCVSEDGFKSQGHFYAVRDPKALEEQYRGPSLWYHMLSFYYPRELTKSSDKLPALSGIVRLIEGQTADKYVAGLWRSQLIEGLTWQAMGTMSGKTSAPPEYRAPSWSWASMDGPFGYLGLGKDPIDTFEKWRDVATVIGCHIDLKGENSYGEITAGWLKIKAPLEPLLPSTEPEPDWETVPHKRALRMTTRNGNAFGAYMMFDTLDQDTASELPLSALVLVQAKGKTGSTYQALIVTPVDGPHGDYRRVGKVILVDDTLGKCGWMDDDTQLETITLV